jgi:hypothetical protein
MGAELCRDVDARERLTATGLGKRGGRFNLTLQTFATDKTR